MWENEPVLVRLEEILAPIGTAKSDPPKLGEAKEFLRAALADRELHLSSDITAAALEDGIKEKPFLSARAAEIKAGHIRLEVGALKRRRYLVLARDPKVKPTEL